MDQPIPPGDTSPLSEALARVGQEPSRAARAAVYARLLDAVVLAPLDPGSTADQAVLLVERVPAGLELPLFTSAAAFRRWGAVPGHLAAAAPELLRAALLQGVERVVLDPSGPVRVTLTSWEVRRLAAGTAPEPDGSPDRDSRTPLGLPDPPLDDAFVDALRAVLRALPAVTEAAVFEADPVRGRRHLVIGLRASDVAALVDPLHDALAAVTPDGALLNYTPLLDGPPFDRLAGASVYRA